MKSSSLSISKQDLFSFIWQVLEKSFSNFLDHRNVSQPQLHLTHLCPWWNICKGSRDVPTSCVGDFWSATNHNWGTTGTEPHGHVLNKLNTNKHWITVFVRKNLQPETQVLQSRDFFKTGRVISLPDLCLNILNYGMANYGIEYSTEKTRASSDPRWHRTHHSAALWEDASCGSHKAAQAVVQLTYLAFPQDILTQMLTHLHCF